MGLRRDTCRVLAEKSEGNNHFEELGVDGGIILKLIFIKRDGAWTGVIWEQVSGCCECGDEPSGSLK